MQTHALRLASALALSVVGTLAGSWSKDNQPTTALATSPPSAEQGALDVLTVIHHGVVDYSQLGVDHGTDPTVKEFAKMMVKDHGDMLKSAYALATKLNIQPQMSPKAAELDKEFKKDIQDLKAKKNGPELDKEFMDEQIDLHQETIGALKEANEQAKDATLKAAIAKELSTMEAHLERAKLVRNKFG